ncbi:MAG: TY-Chap domain-containing protein [Actinomycetota bacterium]
MDNEDAPMGIFESVGPGDVHESFTITADAGGGFEAVAVALARKLAHLATTQHGQHNVTLEVSQPDQNRYVQCIVDQVDGVWVEAVSNIYLKGASRLAPEREAILVDELGFAAPSVDTGPNFSQHVERPVDWAKVGLLLVTTLCEVYDARPNHELTLTIYPHERG